MDRVIRGTGGGGSLEPHGEQTSSASVASGSVVSVTAGTTSMGLSEDDADDTMAMGASAGSRKRQHNEAAREVSRFCFTRDGNRKPNNVHELQPPNSKRCVSWNPCVHMLASSQEAQCV